MYATGILAMASGRQPLGGITHRLQAGYEIAHREFGWYLLLVQISQGITLWCARRLGARAARSVAGLNSMGAAERKLRMRALECNPGKALQRTLRIWSSLSTLPDTSTTLTSVYLVVPLSFPRPTSPNQSPEFPPGAVNSHEGECSFRSSSPALRFPFSFSRCPS